MKLSNEEIAKVYNTYIGIPCVKHPCDSAMFIYGGQIPKGYCTKSYWQGEMKPLLYGDWSGGTNPEYSAWSYCDWGDIKLCLTPLSEITDEHAVEVGKMVMPFDEAKAHSDYFMKIGKSWVKEDSNTMFDLQYDVYLYLISCGYAVPLFFAPNHWANGKPPLDLGIAISKNEVK